MARRPRSRSVLRGAVVAALVLGLTGAALLTTVADAAPGGLVADVVVAEWPNAVSPSVAFDGRYLYHTNYGGSVLHRVDVPPPGGTTTATGLVDVPIQGASSGVMTLAYDAGRDAFWAIGGDGRSMYLLQKSGLANLVFTVSDADRPGFQPVGAYPNEIKVAYDATDDTLWYSSDAGTRIYHYQTYADAQGTAVLVAETPYIDVNIEPNDMSTECGYSQSSGVAVGGADLFVTISGCSILFEFTKTGVKAGTSVLIGYGGSSTQDAECDDRSYAVPVIWIRDGYDGHKPLGQRAGTQVAVLRSFPFPLRSFTLPLPFALCPLPFALCPLL